MGELVVLSRINVEECMNILNLHGNRKGAAGSYNSRRAQGDGINREDSVSNPITKRLPSYPVVPALAH